MCLHYFPDVHYVTDEDEANDETGEVLINDVPGPLELHLAKEQIENEKLREISLSQERAYKKAIKRGNCEVQNGFGEKKHPEYTNYSNRIDTYDKSFRKMRDALQYYGPLEIFETIITPEIYDHIIKESVWYSAISKNNIDTLSVDELKAFIGILMLSSYHKLLSTGQYWSLIRKNL
ncbi:uncharacterized protein LOC115218572 [Octopus sinensis]|uniref:Uncharacterized protein LOC115218572 n=1 Tax=Octopus sinensis TaxID=2607531 RepID=A0A6P7T1T4_9MOLL|nr:uncharacterized protein LOC115218572 [Octopus sinensis]